jgi:hypothetical protein
MLRVQFISNKGTGKVDPGFNVEMYNGNYMTIQSTWNWESDSADSLDGVFTGQVTSEVGCWELARSGAGTLTPSGATILCCACTGLVDLEAQAREQIQHGNDCGGLQPAKFLPLVHQSGGVAVLHAAGVVEWQLLQALW